MKMILGLLLLFSAAFARAQTTPVKEWTFLVYMNADNNLYDYGLRNLKQMQAVGSTSDVNLAVELDPAPSRLPTTRLYIEKGKDPTVLQSLPETNMGDPKHLADFIAWGIKTFPAKHYALVIWNHGNGWHGVSYDDNPDAHLTIPGLAQALRQSQQQLRPTLADRHRLNAPLLDILNFDACLMSSLEVAYEMRGLTNIMIGSQFLEPGEGEDYTAILSKLVSEPRLSPRELAGHMVYEYVRQFPRTNEINYLALDLSKIDAFTAMFRQVATQHTQAAADLQHRLRSFYSQDLSGDDLIGGLTGARKLTGEGSPLSRVLDDMLTAYGYPAENFQRTSWNAAAGFSMEVRRPYPAVLNWHPTMGSPWLSVALTLQPQGDYAATIAAKGPFQYIVQRIRPGTHLILAQEAMSTILRWGADPVVYHDQFPATSPVIAEAHNLRTTGATGMSLYFTSESRLRREVGERAIPGLLNEYLQLAFAKQGAPEWTKFIGL